MPGPAVLLGHMRPIQSDSERRQNAQMVLSALSPASEDLPLPHLRSNSRTESTSSIPQMYTQTFPETNHIILPPEPQPVRLEPLKTPEEGQEAKIELFDPLHGPIDTSLAIAPASPRIGSTLRLPSFHLLGIAARQPDAQSLSLDNSIADVEAGSPIMTDRQELAAVSPSKARSNVFSVGSPSPPKSGSESAKDPSADIFHSPIHQHVTTITPPEESGSINWSGRVTVRLAGVESPTDAPGEGNIESTQATGTGASESNSAQPPATQIPTVIEPTEEMDSWLSAAVEIFLAASHDSKNNGVTSIKVLSHALPSPSATGHAFPKVIKAIQDRMPPNSITWINVSHAVHDRFRLSDLPTSPPVTPASSTADNNSNNTTTDYFSSQIFDSAVSIIDYQLERMPSTSTSSPRPAVSPGSLDLSICERYIPPTSIHEFQNMFSTTTGTSSLLVDRLVELRPDHGRLLFIYPTLRGARTFTEQYLGPILDPIIRSMVVLHGFSADLRHTLGRMSAVSALPDFALLAERLRLLCQDLSSPATASSSSGTAAPGGGGGGSALERLRQGASFAVEYASAERVRLDREVWAREWWVKQEKRRIRDAVTAWFQHARSQPEKIPVDMIEEILHGVATKPQMRVPSEGVEVGVFVIVRKS